MSRPLKVLYINGTVDEACGEALKAGTFDALKTSRTYRTRGIDFVSYDMNYGARSRPLYMGNFAREVSADAIILSGSDKNTTDREDPWVKEYLEGLRRLLEVPAEIEEWSGPSCPVFGICFGHQALACVLGGDTARFQNRTDKVKVRALTGALRHPLFKQIVAKRPDRQLDVVVYHADHVVRMPRDFYPLFSSDYCEVQGMAHLQWPICSLQSHPELDARYLDVPGERESWPTIKDPRELNEQAGPEILAGFAEWAESFR